MHRRDAAIPDFKTLLWDNVKTTAVFGTLITGTAPAIAGGLTGVFFGSCCALPEIGIVTSVLSALPFTLASVAIFALPFTAAAAYTRHFKTQVEIDQNLTLLNSFKTDFEKQQLFAKMTDWTNSTSWGITSYESTKLRYELSVNDSKGKNKNIRRKIIHRKWDLLISYMNKQAADGSYVNNGKKLFNTIVEKSKEVQSFEDRFNNFDKLCVELNELTFVIHQNFWDEKGWGLFSNHAPDSILEFRRILKNSFNATTANKDKIKTIVANLMEVIRMAGESKTRSPSTQKLYDLIKKIGCNEQAAYYNLLPDNSRPPESNFYSRANLRLN